MYSKIELFMYFWLVLCIMCVIVIYESLETKVAECYLGVRKRFCQNSPIACSTLLVVMSSCKLYSNSSKSKGKGALFVSFITR